MLAALREVQHENGGYLSAELMDAVAVYLELPKIWVYEAASFYSMFELEPVGRHSISVCTNISCMLCGGDAIVQHIEQKLGIKVGETTAGQSFLSEARGGVSGGVLRRTDDDGRPQVLRESHAEKVDEIWTVWSKRVAIKFAMHACSSTSPGRWRAI